MRTLLKTQNYFAFSKIILKSNRAGTRPLLSSCADFIKNTKLVCFQLDVFIKVIRFAQGAINTSCADFNKNTKVFCFQQDLFRKVMKFAQVLY